jgi:sorbitol-specific phosphotransferase system component IIA
MTFVSAMLLAFVIAAVGSAMWFGLLQLGHLSKAPQALTKAILLGPFCPREAFTDTGWRYHRWGVAAA